MDSTRLGHEDDTARTDLPTIATKQYYGASPSEPPSKIDDNDVTNNHQALAAEGHGCSLELSNRFVSNR
eukprot:scaffold4070_cov104-Cylindrotheca_fusiformis.AAC.2